MVDSAADFDALLDAAYAALPAIYREACRGVAVRSEPQASADVLEEMGIADPFELLGLYRGVDLTQKSVLDAPGLPDEVILYRDPIIAYARETETPLAEVVTHVLVHEIGHHFGFSDDDMEAIEESEDDEPSEDAPDGGESGRRRE